MKNTNINDTTVENVFEDIPVLKIAEELMIGYRDAVNSHVGEVYEKIIGVAVDYGGTVYWAEKPARHDIVVRDIYEKFGESYSLGQGFITSFNRFLNREEAAELALKNGQAKSLNHAPYLFSEDLW